jgi:hypothetical protein
MRFLLIAMVMGLAWVAGITSAEARSYHHKGDRYDRSHARWSSARHYSGRTYAQRRYAHRAYSYSNSYRSSRSRYAYRSGGYRRYAQRSYAYSGRVHRQYAQRHYYSGRRYASAGAGGRPRAWCGWWMRTQLGGGPEYNLAANWRNYGHASGPQVGAVVVWPHHVGMITGRAANGMWIVKSGNDGNAVRERAMSVSGAVFRSG